MTNKPSDVASDNHAGPAVDSVRTAQEAEAAATQREAEAKLAQGSGPGDGPQPVGDSPKPHGDKLATVVEDITDEPGAKDQP